MIDQFGRKRSVNMLATTGCSANLWTILQAQGYKSKSKQPSTKNSYILISRLSRDTNSEEKANLMKGWTPCRYEFLSKNNIFIALTSSGMNKYNTKERL